MHLIAKDYLYALSVRKFLAIMQYRLKSVLLFIFVLVEVKVSAGTESNAKLFSKYFIPCRLTYKFFSEGEECCYLYGSVPRNESNCVVEGRQIALYFIVYNPHDSFTNFTVRWFRNADPTRAAASSEEIKVTGIQVEYYFFYEIVSMTSLVFQNCSTGPLYRDTFILVINNFTSDKNGYYWCQTYVNNSISQPSQYAWFYAANSSSCVQNVYFLTATTSQVECVILYSKGSVMSPTDQVITSVLETTSESGIITYCIARNFQLTTSIIIVSY